MKKMLCFAVAFFILLAAGCGQQEDSILGSWEMETQASVLGIAAPDGGQTVDVVYRFSFLEDGSGNMRMTADETVPNQDADFTYTLEGDRLVLTYEDGIVQTFTVTLGENTLTLDGRAKLELVRAE